MAMKFSRDVAAGEWPALPRDFVRGEKVERFIGRTYGLDRDDLLYLDRETVAVVNGEGFFTCPVEFLETEDGQPVYGDYVRLPRDTIVYWPRVSAEPTK